ncbi:nucleoside deaminase [Pontibacter sp. G13]|uniref:nucleoside deaminase n=1 Tax=Pontibacter sp. G13 TaxID=3074898 RepID=UPI0028895A70|nr:nucleoside deaminase [Pontibacter sp. G13]WNJ21143.1 nucleoside deaminase [Pontibacter sp. G13]
MLSIHSDDHFMRQALMLAEQAYEEGEIPIGAVVVANYRIVGKGYNQTERLHDPTAHAEMLAITAACEYFGAKYLQDCTLFVTIEPCVMCAGAIKWAQLGRVVYGASEPKTGFSRHQPSLLHPKTIVQGGVESDACRGLMQAFFQEKRKK